MAGVPESLFAPWLRGNARFNQLLHLLRLCRHSIERMPGFVDAAEKWDTLFTPYKTDAEAEADTANIDHLKSLAAKAKTESSSGFATLHAQVVVSLWSIAEHTVEDFMVEWIKYDPSFLEREGITKAKLSIAELIVLRSEVGFRYPLPINLLSNYGIMAESQAAKRRTRGRADACKLMPVGHGCIFGCILAPKHARTSPPHTIIVQANLLKTGGTSWVGTFSRPPPSASSATPPFFIVP
jgi:hypothetical protein